jgi:N-acetylglucosaminyldiphosphoundecaprenol N-acetyl-beta-D-mannosaminyltransferase
MHTYKTVNVLGIRFPILSYAAVLELFQHWIDTRSAYQVCIANVHTVVTSLNDAELRSINNNALTTMDGTPLVWYANLVHGAGIKDRICGPDLMLKCLDQGRNVGWRHYFLGGKPQVLDDLVSGMHSRYPGVQIVGWQSPPFRALSAEEDAELIADINATRPDFLWVGLGAPKQEKWIAAHLQHIQAPVQIGVGAAFDFHSGHVKRAPSWMQSSGLEWIYRMMKDRRLIKRYAQSNPVFLLLFAKDFLLAKVLNVKPG